MSNSTWSRTRLAGLIAVSFALPRIALGAEASDVEDLRREVRQLQAQMQALRSAISEAAELDRQRAAVMTRALKNLPSIPEAEYSAPAKSDPAPAPSRSASASAAPAAARRESVASAAPRHASVSEGSAGVIHGKVAVPAGEPVAYVYVENVMAPPVKGEHKVIQQSGKKFLPGWAVIQRGTTISFPNNDNIYHNVFSLSAGNSFDLGLYNAGSEAKSHTFMEPGPVDVYCNIHPDMAARVLVVPNRYFAKVKPDGTFEIAGVPAGRRKVVAWAPGASPATDWVEVGADKPAELSLKLEPKSGAHKNKAGQSYGSYE
ncbi:MAG TPA: carboxypeptidase regulatory-like domain-containing protein [Polyangia bacterium]|nr:carboxypeptidase regulatory-like domain-containing protein [Polyangia bacterium]